MTDNEKYLAVMLAKLIDALLRKDTEKDGNWGYPSFEKELREMRQSLEDTDGLKEHPKTFLL